MHQKARLAAAQSIFGQAPRVSLVFNVSAKTVRGCLQATRDGSHQQPYLKDRLQAASYRVSYDGTLRRD